MLCEKRRERQPIKTKTVRWISRDPIAEAGGINLYGYGLNDPIDNIDPFGLDIYDALNSFSSNGYGRGGFFGHAQAGLGNIATAVLDTLGGDLVKSLSERSGSASGCGNNLAAAAWGALAIDDILLNALSYGRLGQMLGGTATKAGVSEFSHSIPNRILAGRQWWNGSIVSPYVHAMSDDYRMLRGMSLADKWPAARQFINRVPSWIQGIVGLGDQQLVKRDSNQNQ